VSSPTDAPTELVLMVIAVTPLSSDEGTRPAVAGNSTTTTSRRCAGAASPGSSGGGGAQAEVGLEHGEGGSALADLGGRDDTGGHQARDGGPPGGVPGAAAAPGHAPPARPGGRCARDRRRQARLATLRPWRGSPADGPAAPGGGEQTSWPGWSPIGPGPGTPSVDADPERGTHRRRARRGSMRHLTYTQAPHAAGRRPPSGCVRRHVPRLAFGQGPRRPHQAASSTDDTRTDAHDREEPAGPP
jgi:hypothetical protein